MKKINYWAIIVFYLIAILCRYLTNKTEIFEEEILGAIDYMYVLWSTASLYGLAVSYYYNKKFLFFIIKKARSPLLIKLQGNLHLLKLEI